LDAANNRIMKQQNGTVLPSGAYDGAGNLQEQHFLIER